ncbi:MAG TPA: family 20 glycosylhydrolase [Gemmatimonadaceae bacterium]|nr:family 20 glycosylhydrolase [Gemmatimonadaceae bacterium]
MLATGCSGPSGMRIEETAAAEPAAMSAEPAPAALLPLPASVVRRTGTFTLASQTQLYYSGQPEAAGVAAYLSRLIWPGRATSAQTLPATPVRGAISLVLDASLDSLGPEGYKLEVSTDGITASAASGAGLFYAAQTLRQLLPAEVERDRLPSRQAIHAVTIVDRPRFDWRGAMLDVSRHFLRPADVKRYVDHMALYKLNRLHLHLSDDQGWRIEIKSWPNLTVHGGSTAVGGGPGGFYTQAEYADIVEYARQRFITVVPEIDMPGHTNAALASYPVLNCDDRAPALYTGIRVGFSSLCVSRESTYRFVDDVVREIAAITPGPWFHVGGDEVKTLSAAQYATFVERVQAIVRAHGKEMIGWDEVGATRLHPTTTVQYWRPQATARDAVRQGNRFILSPANKIYLDMKYDSATALGLKWAGFIEVRTAYDWDPATRIAGVSESSIRGIEAPLWSETLVTIDDFEHMAFPRLAAVAEVGWSRQSSRDWEGFRQRLAAQAPRWSALGINFYRSPQIPWP